MLRSLVAHGLRADMVVGSSVGAINGAYYAGTPTVEATDRLTSIWQGMRRRDVFPIAWKTLLGLPFRRDFLVASEGLRRLVQTHLPFRNLEGAAIPLYVVTTNILSGEAVVLPRLRRRRDSRQHGNPGRLRPGAGRRPLSLRRRDHELHPGARRRR
jgi:NTE family protein